MLLRYLRQILSIASFLGVCRTLRSASSTSSHLLGASGSLDCTLQLPAAALPSLSCLAWMGQSGHFYPYSSKKWRNLSLSDSHINIFRMLINATYAYVILLKCIVGRKLVISGTLALYSFENISRLDNWTKYRYTYNIACKVPEITIFHFLI